MNWLSVLPLVSSAIGLAGVALGAWLTGRGGERRFFLEATWQRKAAAYTAVFEGLHDMYVWVDENYHADMRGRDIPDDQAKELIADYKAAKKRIRREIAAATWLLRAEVQTEIDEMWAKLKADHDTWFDVLDTSWGAITTAQVRLRTIAREDLGLAKAPGRKMYLPWRSVLPGSSRPRAVPEAAFKVQ
jgi:hypothetical protein